MIISMVMERFRILRRNRDGVAAIEFGIIALPFFIILLGIIEVGLTVFLDSTLNTGVRAVARQGIAQGYRNQGEIADIMKGHMAGFYRDISSAGSDLEIRIFAVPNFDSGPQYAQLNSYAAAPKLIFEDAAPGIPPLEDQRGAIVVYAARYKWGGFTQLLSWVIPEYVYSITVVRNEAF